MLTKTLKVTLNKKTIGVTALAVFLMAGVAVASAQTSSTTVQDQINSLTDKLHQAVQQEMSTGQLTTNQYGQKVFTGASAEKMANLEKETAHQIDALVARSASERAAAIANIKAFAGNQNLDVTYRETGKSSYNNAVKAEFYTSGQDYYEVDPRNNQIIQFGPAPVPSGQAQKKYDTTPRYNQDQLEAMARNFISTQTKVDLSKLSEIKGEKAGTNYFFRWEDTSRMLQNMHPFIQVGYTTGGDILSYTDTLGL